MGSSLVSESAKVAGKKGEEGREEMGASQDEERGAVRDRSGAAYGFITQWDEVCESEEATTFPIFFFSLGRNFLGSSFPSTSIMWWTCSSWMVWILVLWSRERVVVCLF